MPFHVTFRYVARGGGRQCQWECAPLCRVPVGATATMSVRASSLSSSLFVLADQEALSSSSIAIVGAVVECLQLAGTVFPDTGSAAWTAADTAPIRSVLHVCDQNLLAALFGPVATSYVVSVITVALLASFVAIGYAHDAVGESAVRLASRVLRRALSASTTILYLPILRTFLAMLLSSSPPYIALAAVCLPPFVVLAATCTCTLFDQHFESTSPTARPHSRLEMAYFLARTAVPIVMVAFPKPVIAVCISFVIVSVVTYLFVRYVPYYSMQMVRVRCTLLVVVDWVLLSALVGMISADPTRSGAVSMLAAGVPTLAALTPLLVDKRIAAIRRTDDDKLGSAWDAEVKFRLLLCDVYRDTDPDTSERCEAARAINERNERLYPSAPITMLRSALLHVTLFHVPFMANTAIATAMASSATLPDLWFALRRLQRVHAQHILRSEASRDIVTYVEYVGRRGEAARAETELARALLALWRELTLDVPNVTKMRSMAHVVSVEMGAARAAYADCLRRWTGSPTTYRMYADFLGTLLNDQRRASKYRGRASDLGAHAGAASLSFRASLFNDDNCVLIVSGESHNLGEIVSASSAVSNVFGAGRAAVIGKNVSTLMPDPFSTAHSHIMRRNLSRGTNAILDQRRRLVCRRVDDGTVFDATVFLKLFIDQEHLSVLGVVDTRQHRSVDGDATAIVVLDENGIVTATCRQAPTVFDVRPGLRFEDAVPGWNGQSRTGALMTTAGRRRRIDIDAEPFTLGNEDGATAACVARIKVSSSSHMGTESETGLGAGAAPNLTDLQVAMLNDDGEDDEGNDGSAIEVTFTDDEDDDDEESQLLDKATNGGGASSATSATGAGDTTSQDDDATQRQRALLTWLQRATVMLSIVLCVVTLASLPIRSALLSSQVATIAKLSSSASRSTDLITIALCAQDLKDMSVGILDPSGQSGTRADIVAFAADVAAKNGASIQRGDLADTALIDDLTMSMAYANEIAMMPLNALASSAVVAFLMENSAGPVADRVLRVDQSMEDQFAYDLNAYSTFGTVVIVLVAIGVTLLAVLALRGVVVTALRDRDDVFLQLLRIPRQHIRALIPPTLKHLTLLTAAGDMTVQEGADANPVATETPATSQGAADRRNEDAITEGSGARRARYLQVARRLFVIIILNAAALAAATAVLGSLSTRMGAFPAIYDWSWREEAAARRALLSVRQAIASNTTVSYAAAQADIQTASDVMNALIYGSPADGIPSGRLDASAPLFQLMFSSMCTLPALQTVSDCTTYRSGVAVNGLHAVLVDFFTLTKTLLASASAPGASGRAVAMSSDMHDAQVLEKVYLRPGLRAMIAITDTNLSSARTAQITYDGLVVAGIVVIVILVHVVVIRPLLREVSDEFMESTDLVRLVPEDMRDSGSNANDADISSLIVPLDEDIDDRDVAAIAAQRAQRRRLDAIQRRNRRSVLHRLYGLLAKHPGVAFAVAIAIPVALQFRFWKVAVPATKTLIPAALLAITSVVSAATPLDISSMTYAFGTALLSLPVGQVRELAMVQTALGGSAATINAILTGAPLDRAVILYGTLGGVVGSTIGLSLPDPGPLAEVIITGAWVAFLTAMGVVRLGVEAPAQVELPRRWTVRVDLALFGLVGGIVSGLTGTGLSMALFTLSSSYFCVDANVAVRSAVVAGAGNAVLLCAIKLAMGAPWHPGTVSILMAAVPVGIVLMPLAIRQRPNLPLIGLLAVVQFAAVVAATSTGDADRVITFAAVGTLAVLTAVAVVVGTTGVIQTVNRTGDADHRQQQLDKDGDGFGVTA